MPNAETVLSLSLCHVMIMMAKMCDVKAHMS